MFCFPNLELQRGKKTSARRGQYWPYPLLHFHSILSRPVIHDCFHFYWRKMQRTKNKILYPALIWFRPCSIKLSSSLNFPCQRKAGTDRSMSISPRSPIRPGLSEAKFPAKKSYSPCEAINHRSCPKRNEGMQGHGADVWATIKSLHRSSLTY